MQTRTIDIGGSITFWTTAATNLDALRSGLQSIGWGHMKITPRTHRAALQTALLTVFHGERELIVRPTAERMKLAVVHEERAVAVGDDSGTVVATVECSDDDDSLVINTDTRRMYQIETINDAYRKALGSISARAVALMLSEIVRQLNGVQLKPNGGVYWLPDSKCERWSQVAAVVEQSPANGTRSEIHIMQTAHDARAMRAIRAGISAEISNELERMNAEVDAGNLGQRALLSRVDYCKQLRGRLGEYEGILDETLDSVRKFIDDTEQHAAIAQIHAAAAAGESKS